MTTYFPIDVRLDRATAAPRQKPRIQRVLEVAQHAAFGVLVFAAVIGALSLVVQQLGEDHRTTDELRNIMLIRQGLVEEVLLRGETEFIDEMFSPHATIELPGTQLRGPDGARQLMALFDAAAPERVFTISNIDTMGDQVVLDFRIVGDVNPAVLGMADHHDGKALDGRLVATVINGDIQELRLVPVR